MNTFELEIFDDGAVCTFYTVRWEGVKLSETEKFFNKYNTHSRLKSAFQKLTVFIFKKIADESGALEEYFKFENTAQALPPGGTHQIGELYIDYGNFPLRLYCLRISDELVILFNGGEKTANTAQGGKTSMAFIEANQFAKRILEALKENEIYISEGKTFKDYTDSTEIIL